MLLRRWSDNSSRSILWRRCCLAHRSTLRLPRMVFRFAVYSLHSYSLLAQSEGASHKQHTRTPTHTWPRGKWTFWRLFVVRHSTLILLYAISSSTLCFSTIVVNIYSYIVLYSAGRISVPVVNEHPLTPTSRIAKNTYHPHALWYFYEKHTNIVWRPSWSTPMDSISAAIDMFGWALVGDGEVGKTFYRTLSG